ncbi:MULTISPECIES: putative entry exclusion protein TrbK-alt [unclassified Mesorhizobium]|uniref:putative entry exclusion protein TrbK-alt n=1 Tax=unclassified Mesorhizobium TaxID=325217 RepID=UPI0011273D07|nr:MULTISPECIES: putative entry exclusion protein TrbK-alt [unclassified Mesorhizobium]MBZ9956429.1 putative entry exclusion protein TrbK-alt [Mesorhizobium sp. BR1-1-15]MBZ9962061.1 putative entry exclusion protein TrbK-alt [Mesorhizobium sp. BR1-1-14]TPN55876.1 conjugal transfer protein TrbK [Mesorhizobium sp. B1-1-4]
MDGKILARTVAGIFVAAAFAAAALGVSRKGDMPAGEGAHTTAGLMPDPLREGLRRCQLLGEAALRDDGCARLWAEQRDRFLGLEKRSRSSIGEPAASRPPDAVMLGDR